MKTDRRRILIVDDSGEDREYTKRLLSRAAEFTWQFTEASDGQRGLALAVSGGPFDCILLDYRLRDMEGTEFLQLLPKQFGEPGVAVVVLAGAGDETVAVRVMKSGALGYLSKKDLNATSLAGEVEHAVAHFQLTQVNHQSAKSLADSEARYRGLARELAASNQILERSNHELQRFAYVASHDLQSPLRSISGFVQLLKMNYEGKLDEQADDWIRRTVEAIAQMQFLIKDLLAYSRVDARLRPFMPTSFLDVFHDTVGLLESSIRDGGAQVTCGELPVILGERSQLVQLMDNLIGNGLKYHGKKPPRIHVSAERSGTQWILSVCDNGIGIAPEYCERIFEIFQRLHDNKDYPGTGIGLAICRRIVGAHGGRIWAESEPGQGSAFHFTIPALGDKLIGEQTD